MRCKALCCPLPSQEAGATVLLAGMLRDQAGVRWRLRHLTNGNAKDSMGVNQRSSISSKWHCITRG